MKVNIYQINSEKDKNRVKFCGYEETEKHGGVIPENYKCVFHGFVEAKDLDDVYAIFNIFGESYTTTFQGHSLSVSDIVEIEGDVPEIYGRITYFHDSTEYVDPNGTTAYYTDADQYEEDLEDARKRGQSVDFEILKDQHLKLCEEGCFFCDNVGWKKIDFDTSQVAEMDGVRMLMILPHRPPVVTYVKDNLHDLQMAVSDHGEEALIEYTYPFDDDCMVLGNEEAKLNGMEGNRRLYGSIYAGPIYITRDDGVGGLCSLTDEQVQQYSEMFAEPHDISDEETQADVGFTSFGWY